MTEITWKATTLRDYIRILLDEGKRGNHEDFKVLYRLYGYDYVVKMAIEEKEKMKNESS